MEIQNNKNMPEDLQSIDNERQPVFNNFPLGTMFILAIMIIIHIVRGFEDNGQVFSWVLQSAFIPARFFEHLAFKANGFETYWPLVGYQFLHAGYFHLIMNSGMLIQAGPIAEMGFIKNANIVNYRHLKSNPQYKVRRARAAFWFFIYFIICGIGSALGFYIINKEPNVLLMGASGSISGVFAGFLWSAYNMAPKGSQIFKLLFMSASVFLVINVGGAAFARITNFIPIAWEAHLFGFVTGLIIYPIFYFALRRY